MYSIIIVDDEELITLSLHKYITKFHPELHCVGTFTDGESVLDFLQTTSVDIIITDILMPGMDGLEMIRRIRKLMPEVAMLSFPTRSCRTFPQKGLKIGSMKLWVGTAAVRFPILSMPSKICFPHR